MATYVIKAVHLEPQNYPSRHDHIEKVRLTDKTVELRSTVIAKIRAGHRYVTAANPPGLVYVHPCPWCRAHDYITTHPDNTPTNNLLHLPRF
jgi:hypothetical protein